MNLDLTGKVALVTGSSKGIGREIAESLQREGCVIVLNARNSEELAKVIREMGLDPDKQAITGDVTHVDECIRMVSDVLRYFGRLDILICNVGSGRSVAPGNETPEEWERVFALNLWSVTNMVEAAKQALAATKGTIACISSICGIEVIPGAPVTYSVAKTALNAYVRGIARPLGKLGIRINAIAPGNIIFEGSVWAHRLKEDRSEVDRMLKQEVALASLGRPADVGNLICYLVSPLAGFATGGIYVIDGGQIRSQ